MDVVNKLKEVQQRVQRACARVNRSTKEVRLIAVTKYLDLEGTRQFLDLGLNHLGESRTQHAIPKIEYLGSTASWHFIGSLQKNKAKELPGRFTYLHSLDRYSLALELDKQFKKNKGTLKCFIQVNVSGEESKHGIFPNELKEFLNEASGFTSLKMIGLMTMAPKTAKPKEVRLIFRELKDLQKEVQLQHHSVSHLSMGMSQDYEIAIEEGATWIRLGTALVES